MSGSRFLDISYFISIYYRFFLYLTIKSGMTHLSISYIDNVKIHSVCWKYIFLACSIGGCIRFIIRLILRSRKNSDLSQSDIDIATRSKSVAGFVFKRTGRKELSKKELYICVWQAWPEPTANAIEKQGNMGIRTAKFCGDKPSPLY